MKDLTEIIKDKVYLPNVYEMNRNMNHIQAIFEVGVSKDMMKELTERLSGNSLVNKLKPSNSITLTVDMNHKIDVVCKGKPVELTESEQSAFLSRVPHYIFQKFEEYQEQFCNEFLGTFREKTDAVIDHVDESTHKSLQTDFEMYGGFLGQIKGLGEMPLADKEMNPNHESCFRITILDLNQQGYDEDVVDDTIRTPEWGALYRYPEIQEKLEPCDVKLERLFFKGEAKPQKEEPIDTETIEIPEYMKEELKKKVIGEMNKSLDNFRKAEEVFMSRGKEPENVAEPRHQSHATHRSAERPEIPKR